MTQIFYSSASPYSAKVRMAAHLAGISAESVSVSTSAEPEALIRANPLGKIPTLVTDDGKAVFDSRAITQYLNRVSGGRLFPRNADRRTDAERYEALADGLADVLLVHVYERRMRPEEKIHQPWLDLQWRKAQRALDLLNEAPPRLSGKLHAGHLAVAATLGYLALRFEGKWERGRPKLKRWLKRFQELHPDLAALLPSG